MPEASATLPSALWASEESSATRRSRRGSGSSSTADTEGRDGAGSEVEGDCGAAATVGEADGAVPPADAAVAAAGGTVGAGGSDGSFETSLLVTRSTRVGRPLPLAHSWTAETRPTPFTSPRAVGNPSTATTTSPTCVQRVRDGACAYYNTYH